MDASTKGVIDYFISYILSQDPLARAAEESALEKRKQLAHSIIKKPEAQKIVLNTLVRLSPIVWGELSRHIPLPELEAESLPRLKKDEELILGTGPIEDTDVLKKHFEEVCSEVDRLKGMVNDYNNTFLNPTVSQYEIIRALSRAEEDITSSDNLVSLLKDMESYEPPFILDIRDISHDVWEEHHAQEKKIDEARQKKDMQSVIFATEMAQKEEWIKQKAGLKIKRIEEAYELMKHQLTLMLERKSSEYEDLLSSQLEEMMKEEEVLNDANNTEVIEDLPTALQKISKMNMARSILEKKITSHEKTIKGLNYKVEMLNKTNKEQLQSLGTARSTNERLKNLVVALVDLTGMLEEYKNSAKASIKEEKLSKLEDMLKNHKYEVTKAEFAARKVIEVKKKFILQIKQNEGRTKEMFETMLKSLNLDDPEFTVEETPKAKLLSPNQKQKQRPKSPAKKSESTKAEDNKSENLDRNLGTTAEFTRQNTSVKQDYDDKIKGEDKNTKIDEEDIKNTLDRPGKSHKTQVIFRKTDQSEDKKSNLNPQRQTTQFDRKSLENAGITNKSNDDVHQSSINKGTSHMENQEALVKKTDTNELNHEELGKTPEIAADLRKTDNTDLTKTTDITGNTQYVQNISEDLVQEPKNQTAILSPEKQETKNPPAIFVSSEEPAPVNSIISLKPSIEDNDEPSNAPQTSLNPEEPVEVPSESIQTPLTLKEVFIPMEYTPPETIENKQSLKVVAYKLLLRLKKLHPKQFADTPKLKELLGLSFSGQSLQDIIVQGIWKFFVPKKDMFSETDVSSQLSALKISYGPMIRHLINKTSEIANKPVVRRKKFSNEPLQDWLINTSNNLNLSSAEYYAEFQIETQRKGLKKVDDAESTSIWGEIIDRRVEDGEPDNISKFMRGFVGTKEYLNRKSEVIKLLQSRNIKELLALLTEIPKASDMTHVKKKLNPKVIEKWSVLVRKSREKIAKNLTAYVQPDTRLELWYEMATHIKFVKHRLSTLVGRNLHFNVTPVKMNREISAPDKWTVFNTSSRERTRSAIRTRTIVNNAHQKRDSLHVHQSLSKTVYNSTDFSKL